MKGKAYAHSDPAKRNPNDFYSTPKSLVWVASSIIYNEFSLYTKKGNNIGYPILEPAAGEGAISSVLTHKEYIVWSNDLNIPGCLSSFDYLNQNKLDKYKYVITNPPFSFWDKFVEKAKTHCLKFMFIGRMNYFGTYSRYKSGLWKNLKAVYPFNRYVDYRTPYREDGLFHVGAMQSGWFLWDMEYEGQTTMEILDVQKYARLGAYKDPNKGETL